MSIVNLEDNEWNYLLTVLGDKPWREVNGLLMKIGSQLQSARQKMDQERFNAPARFSEPADTRASASRLPPEIAPANSGHSPEQRQEGSGKAWPRSQPLQAPEEP